MTRFFVLSTILLPASALASMPSGSVSTTPCDLPAAGSGNERLCECYATAKAEEFVDLYTGVSGTPLNSYVSGMSCFALNYSLNNAGMQARNKYGTKFQSAMADAEATLEGMSYTFGGFVIADYRVTDSDGDLLRDKSSFMSADGGMDPTGGDDLPVLPGIDIIELAPGHWLLEDENGNPSGEVFGGPSDELRVGYSTDVGEDGILDFAFWTEAGGSFELHGIQAGAVYDLNNAVPGQ